MEILNLSAAARDRVMQSANDGHRFGSLLVRVLFGAAVLMGVLALWAYSSTPPYAPLALMAATLATGKFMGFLKPNGWILATIVIATGLAIFYAGNNLPVLALVALIGFFGLYLIWEQALKPKHIELFAFFGAVLNPRHPLEGAKYGVTDIYLGTVVDASRYWVLYTLAVLAVAYTGIWWILPVAVLAVYLVSSFGLGDGVKQTVMVSIGIFILIWLAGYALVEMLDLWTALEESGDNVKEAVQTHLFQNTLALVVGGISLAYMVFRFANPGSRGQLKMSKLDWIFMLAITGSLLWSFVVNDAAAVARDGKAAITEIEEALGVSSGASGSTATTGTGACGPAEAFRRNTAFAVSTSCNTRFLNRPLNMEWYALDENGFFITGATAEELLQVTGNTVKALRPEVAYILWVDESADIATRNTARRAAVTALGL